LLANIANGVNGVNSFDDDSLERVKSFDDDSLENKEKELFSFYQFITQANEMGESIMGESIPLFHKTYLINELFQYLLDPLLKDSETNRKDGETNRRDGETNRRENRSSFVRYTMNRLIS
jgi:hypothetical protein